MSDRFPNLGPMPSRQGHTPSTSTGAASAQAGMVRIQRGSETRYVWPVHLPGWLAIGWQVGSGEGMAAATPPAVVVTPSAVSSQPPAATPSGPTPGTSGHRSGTPVGTGSTGRPAPAASAPQPVPATSNTGSGDSTTPPAAQKISMPAATDSPRQPEADLTAHLPTNLLGLDPEPDGGHATPAENDAVSASNPEPDAAAAEVNPPADETAAEPPARRRGRPRKVRPEAQPMPPPRRLIRSSHLPPPPPRRRRHRPRCSPAMAMTPSGSIPSSDSPSISPTSTSTPTRPA
jgi:hypothetical protein